MTTANTCAKSCEYSALVVAAKGSAFAWRDGIAASFFFSYDIDRPSRKAAAEHPYSMSFRQLFNPRIGASAPVTVELFSKGCRGGSNDFVNAAPVGQSPATEPNFCLCGDPMSQETCVIIRQGPRTISINQQVAGLHSALTTPNIIACRRSTAWRSVWCATDPAPLLLKLHCHCR